MAEIAEKDQIQPLRVSGNQRLQRFKHAPKLKCSRSGIYSGKFDGLCYNAPVEVIDWQNASSEHEAFIN